MDTTLSILKMLLLCFIILDLTSDHVTTHSIHHTEFFFFFFFFFFFYLLNLIFYIIFFITLNYKMYFFKKCNT